MSVDTPPNTNLIILKSSGTIEQSETNLAIQNDILQRLIKKYNATSQSVKNGFNSQILKLNSQLEDLQNEKLFAGKELEVKSALTTKRNGLIKLQEEEKSLDDSLIRLQALAALLKEQYNTDIENLKTALKNQHQATKGRADTALLVLLTSELQQYRTHIAALNERLNIKLPTRQENLTLKIANNKRAQESQRVLIKQAENAVDKLYINRGCQINLLKSQILKIENDIKSLSTTHALVPPSPSFEPVNGKKKFLIIAVSGVLGFFIALFAALFAGFLAKVKD